MQHTGDEQDTALVAQSGSLQEVVCLYQRNIHMTVNEPYERKSRYIPRNGALQKDKTKIDQRNILDVRSQQQGSNFDWR